MVIMTIPETIEKPHVAFLPSPGMGHITPLFEFAKRLVIHHGFHVSFFVITTGASAAQNELFRSENLPSDFTAVEIPPVENIASFFTDDMRVVTRLAIMVRESLKHLPSLLMEKRPKALIIDLFCTDAFEICQKLSIPVYSFFTASTILMAFSLYLPTLDREVEGEFVDLPEPIQTPGCNPIRPHDILDQVNLSTKADSKFEAYVLRPDSASVYVSSLD